MCRNMDKEQAQSFRMGLQIKCTQSASGDKDDFSLSDSNTGECKGQCVAILFKDRKEKHK